MFFSSVCGRNKVISLEWTNLYCVITAGFLNTHRKHLHLLIVMQNKQIPHQQVCVICNLCFYSHKTTITVVQWRASWQYWRRCKDDFSYGEDQNWLPVNYENLEGRIQNLAWLIMSARTSTVFNLIVVDPVSFGRQVAEMNAHFVLFSFLFLVRILVLRRVPAVQPIFVVSTSSNTTREPKCLLGVMIIPKHSCGHKPLFAPNATFRHVTDLVWLTFELWQLDEKYHMRTWTKAGSRNRKGASFPILPIPSRAAEFRSPPLSIDGKSLIAFKQLEIGGRQLLNSKRESRVIFDLSILPVSNIFRIYDATSNRKSPNACKYWW